MGRAGTAMGIDAAVLLGVAAIGFSAMEVAVEWEQPLRPAVVMPSLTEALRLGPGFPGVRHRLVPELGDRAR
jgi:hypothetical protein